MFIHSYNIYLKIASFAGMGYLTLYLAGKLHVFDRKGHTYKGFVVIAPLILAMLICISRTQDYRHHWQDVIAGSFIGNEPILIKLNCILS
jgi:diacylglycerol diphosphate phosphatase/phosphatidate phosphatase